MHRLSSVGNLIRYQSALFDMFSSESQHCLTVCQLQNCSGGNSIEWWIEWHIYAVQRFCWKDGDKCRGLCYIAQLNQRASSQCQQQMMTTLWITTRGEQSTQSLSSFESPIVTQRVRTLPHRDNFSVNGRIFINVVQWQTGNNFTSETKKWGFNLVLTAC